MMQRQQFYPFSRDKHIYKNENIDKILIEIIRFFNGTPVQSLPPKDRFIGAGVYSLYYTGNNYIYSNISTKNNLEYTAPIYIGKAVPQGWRQSKIATSSNSHELYRRLSEHAKSIQSTHELDIEDFATRFVIFEGPASGMIATVEAKMIEIYKPIWNSCIDGFGNHDPGKGRYKQAMSEWDCLHPGRAWAEKLEGIRPDRMQLLNKIQKFFEKK